MSPSVRCSCRMKVMTRRPSSKSPRGQGWDDHNIVSFLAGFLPPRLRAPVDSWQRQQDGGAMEFPLKTDFFPQVRLTTEERRRYVSTGECNARALRGAVRTLAWKKTLEKDGVTFAQAHCIEETGGIVQSPSEAETGGAPGEAKAAASACLMMSATAYAAGTITEALEALASPVTEDYRRAMHFLHGPRFLDGVCLHTIAPVTGTDNNNVSTESCTQAFTTVKWAAFDDGKALNAASSPTGTDYCFLEHSGIQRGHSNADNNEPELFGFSIQESIAREREVPSLAGFGLGRGNFHRTGILILPTDRTDVVQITSILQMRMADGAAVGAATDGTGPASSSGKGAAVALARLMRRRVAAVGRLDLLLERRRLSKLELVPRTDWVADDARKACTVCVKPFTLRRRKHHCRHCGEVVCASCASTREVDASANASTIHVRICTACVVQARVGSRELQTPGGYDVFVHHLRRTGSSASSQTSSNSTGEGERRANNNDEHNRGHEGRPMSLSSGSSNFSIASDSRMSARMTRAGYRDGVGMRLYDHEGHRGGASSSGSSSSYSLSEFDTFDSLVIVPPSANQQGGALRQRRGSRQLSSPLAATSSELSGDLLERIRGMKADLSTLTTSFHRHHSNSSNSSNVNSTANHTAREELSTVEASTAPTSTGRDGEAEAEDGGRRRTRSSDGEDPVDVDFINNSEHFTLLCPETLRRRRRTRTSSHVRQDAGEKSRRATRASNMSFISTFSSSTLLDDDDEEAEEHESPELQHEPLEAGGRSQSQAELLALQQQVEGLHRSLAAATSQLHNFSRRASRQTQPPADPVIARHEASYGLLVEELHEIMGLPRPSRARS
ncbi:hypothetical protein BBJ28_00021879 [Nothophytophthora sp. Chile5]|nr:hypothetical protein BBJ28_00021879 [Nothophytophthora sp. Chile5]